MSDITPKARLLNSQLARDLGKVPVEQPDKVEGVITKMLLILPAIRETAPIEFILPTGSGEAAGMIAKATETNALAAEDLGVTVFGMKLMAACGSNHLEDVPGWRLRDDISESKVVKGRSILFVLGPTGGMASLPKTISRGWIRDHIIWVAGDGG